MSEPHDNPDTEAVKMVQPMVLSKVRQNIDKWIEEVDALLAELREDDR